MCFNGIEFKELEDMRENATQLNALFAKTLDDRSFLCKFRNPVLLFFCFFTMICVCVALFQIVAYEWMMGEVYTSNSSRWWLFCNSIQDFVSSSSDERTSGVTRTG